MRRFGYLALALGLGFISNNAFASPGISIKFANKSDYSIHHIYLTETKEKEWGPDQLGDEDNSVIEPGETFTLTDIAPNKYDVMLVDEDKDECIVSGVKIAANETVEITNADLIGCQSSTENAEANG